MLLVDTPSGRRAGPVGVRHGGQARHDERGAALRQAGQRHGVRGTDGPVQQAVRVGVLIEADIGRAGGDGQVVEGRVVVAVEGKLGLARVADGRAQEPRGRVAKAALTRRRHREDVTQRHACGLSGARGAAADEESDGRRESHAARSTIAVGHILEYRALRHGQGWGRGDRWRGRSPPGTSAPGLRGSGRLRQVEGNPAHPARARGHLRPRPRPVHA